MIKMKKGGLAILTTLTGLIVGAICVGNKMNRIVEEKEINSEKFRIMYQMMERWMRIKQSNESLDKYFKIYGYKKIAIYGMGDIGKLLLNEIQDSDVQIEFGIDKNNKVSAEIEIFKPEDDLPEVDAIIVTAIAYFDEIEKILSKKMTCPIISLEDIVYEME